MTIGAYLIIVEYCQADTWIIPNLLHIDIMKHPRLNTHV